MTDFPDFPDQGPKAICNGQAESQGSWESPWGVEICEVVRKASLCRSGIRSQRRHVEWPRQPGSVVTTSLNGPQALGFLVGGLRGWAGAQTQKGKEDELGGAGVESVMLSRNRVLLQ